MELVSLNPFDLYLTDPLWALQERRNILTELFEKRKVPPIYVVPIEDQGYLIFNGNKRTVIGRERFQPVPGYVLKENSDIVLAQHLDPREFKTTFDLVYDSVVDHLTQRARRFRDLNQRFSPVSLEVGRARVLSLLEERKLRGY